MNPPALRPGELLPHFTVQTLDGAPFAYASVWQHRHLVLVMLPSGPELDAWAADLAATVAKWSDCALVVTRDRIAGVPGPAVVVADRWGEVAQVVPLADAPRSIEDVLATLDHVRRRCPECEGEAR